MKHIPILFSTPMVQAILDGRKTMTRRVVKEPHQSWMNEDTNAEWWSVADNLSKYQKGDVLWVRETWQETTWLHSSNDEYGYIYKASLNGKVWECNDEGWKWRPSLFMPKSACRIFLEVVSVKVERLNEITERDTIAEGIEWLNRNEFSGWKVYTDYLATTSNPKVSFQSLWQSIKGADSWQANPFVWCISFKRIDKPENFI
jgi:hypothetical protein